MDMDKLMQKYSEYPNDAEVVARTSALRVIQNKRLNGLDTGDVTLLSWKREKDAYYFSYPSPVAFEFLKIIDEMKKDGVEIKDIDNLEHLFQYDTEFMASLLEDMNSWHKSVMEGEVYPYSVDEKLNKLERRVNNASMVEPFLKDVYGCVSEVLERKVVAPECPELLDKLIKTFNEIKSERSQLLERAHQALIQHTQERLVRKYGSITNAVKDYLKDTVKLRNDAYVMLQGREHYKVRDTEYHLINLRKDFELIGVDMHKVEAIAEDLSDMTAELVDIGELLSNEQRSVNDYVIRVSKSINDAKERYQKGDIEGARDLLGLAVNKIKGLVKTDSDINLVNDLEDKVSKADDGYVLGELIKNAEDIKDILVENLRDEINKDKSLVKEIRDKVYSVYLPEDNAVSIEDIPGYIEKEIPYELVQEGIDKITSNIRERDWVEINRPVEDEDHNNSRTLSMSVAP